MNRGAHCFKPFATALPCVPNEYQTGTDRQGVHVLIEQQLVESVRTALAGIGTVREVKMFGGIGCPIEGL